MMDTEENISQGRWGRFRWLWGILTVGIAVVFLVTVLPFYLAPACQEMSFSQTSRLKVDSALLNEKTVKAKLSRLKQDVAVLEKRLDGFLPHKPYIVINTTRNRFYLYDKNGEVVREGFCSSGSYTKLVSEKRTWIFKTPKGRMTVLSKTENPVWTKPDWAFIEEGLPVPKYGDPARYEKGVLGDYALRMADGYLLHGTLYQRLLGMPVTHGCVRFGDDDLKAVYQTLAVGSYVYIY